MANPFLVLGGIAVGIITAAFGVLAVPGWVASAQDASVTNDISQVSLAQAASMSQNGAYLPALADLKAMESVKLSLGPASKVGAATDPTGKHHVVVAQSDSGRIFARTSESATIGSGATRIEAVTATGTTVNAAGITAEGVEVPAFGDVVARNYFTNPLASSLFGFASAHSAVSHSTIANFPGVTSTAIRATRTSGGGTRHFDLIVGRDLPLGKPIKVTATLRLSEATVIDLSLRPDMNSVTVAAADRTLTLAAGVHEVEWTWAATASVPTTAASGVTVRSNTGTLNSTIDITRISITSPDSGFFHGGSGKVGDATASWVGTPGQSQSVLTK